MCLTPSASTTSCPTVRTRAPSGEHHALLDNLSQLSSEAKRPGSAAINTRVGISNCHQYTITRQAHADCGGQPANRQTVGKRGVEPPGRCLALLRRVLACVLNTQSATFYQGPDRGSFAGCHIGPTLSHVTPLHRCVPRQPGDPTCTGHAMRSSPRAGCECSAWSAVLPAACCGKCTCRFGLSSG